MRQSERTVPSLWVALDVPVERAKTLVGELRDLPVGFKVGLSLFAEAGPDLVRGLRDRGYAVFLDLKLHDIPMQVGRAIESIQALGVLATTIHLQGGDAMVRAAVRATSSDLLVLGVTELTSVGGEPAAVAERVVTRARAAFESGVGGVVCSGREAAAVRAATDNDFAIVTPGIRPADPASADDQKRVTTAAEARASGASSIVVGRPIHGSDNPRLAVEGLLTEMSHVE